MLRDKAISTGASAVHLVALRICLVVALMIVLRRIELLCRLDFCCNWTIEASACLEFLLRSLCKLPLLLVIVIDPAPVRAAAVMELTTCICRIDLPPEYIKQLLIWKDARIIRNLYRFCMPGRLRANFFIGRING